MRYGYARVSTADQDLTIQQNTLKAAGCSIVRSEKISGTSRQGREELDTILQFLRQGDSLVVTRVDRLARSMGDLQDIMREIRGKGCSLVMTEQNIDTSTAAGKAFVDMLGVFAEFETNIRAERQREGIAAVRASRAGAYTGRAGRPTNPIAKLEAKKEAVLALVAEIGKEPAARRLGVSKSTIYRFLKDHGRDLVADEFEGTVAARMARVDIEAERDAPAPRPLPPAHMTI